MLPGSLPNDVSNPEFQIPCLKVTTNDIVTSEEVVIYDHVIRVWPVTQDDGQNIVRLGPGTGFKIAIVTWWETRLSIECAIYTGRIKQRIAFMLACDSVRDLMLYLILNVMIYDGQRYD